MERPENETVEISPPVPTIYTIGHGNRTAEDFLEVLRLNAIACVVDVRAYPNSRRHPHFSRNDLINFLKEAGIAYHWLGKALGGFRHGSPDSIHTALTSASWQAYADHMVSEAFRKGIEELMACARNRPSVMLCAERLPQHCHRSLISDYLTAGGISVSHILGRDECVVHQINSLARWSHDMLIYDQGHDRQLEWKF